MNAIDDEQWHVVPLNDMREHDTNGNCWCNPMCNDEGIYSLWTHNSMDGSESYKDKERLN